MTAATPATPAGLVLAAGAGRRFGGPKALVEIDGQLLVDRAVSTLRAGGCDPVVVVLGAAAHDVCAKAELEHAVVVVNDDWSAGMGSTLRVGLAALTDLGVRGAVIALVDQPRVTAAIVQRLVHRWRDGAVAAVATYRGEPRNPVLLDASTWPAVAEVAVGDVGARAWLRNHPDDVTPVACDDLGSDVDIDEPADLHDLTSDTAMEDKS